ncbi:hypothetical protein BJ165DRAFT_1399821 [Panaeolus papilionaceus]|nr:hypothetical protein BJ165DRAFT_1399821 [Panaeolus papilionaceus]
MYCVALHTFPLHTSATHVCLPPSMTINTTVILYYWTGSTRPRLSKRQKQNHTAGKMGGKNMNHSQLILVLFRKMLSLAEETCLNIGDRFRVVTACNAAATVTGIVQPQL